MNGYWLACFAIMLETYTGAAGLDSPVSSTRGRLVKPGMTITVKGRLNHDTSDDMAQHPIN